MRPLLLLDSIISLMSDTVLVAPFVRPPNGVGDTPPLPYYLCVLRLSMELLLTLSQRYCLVAIAVMVFSVFYWATWWVVLPRLFKYKLVPVKDKLSDGTVVTIVSTPHPPVCYRKLTDSTDPVDPREGRVKCSMSTPAACACLLYGLSRANAIDATEASSIEPSSRRL